MAEYAGMPKVKKEDLPKFYHDQSTYVRHFENIDRVRVVIVFPYDLWDQFEEAVKKKYGSISYVDVDAAALDAVKLWSEKVLKGEA